MYKVLVLALALVAGCGGDVTYTPRDFGPISYPDLAGLGSPFTLPDFSVNSSPDAGTPGGPGGPADMATPPSGTADMAPSRACTTWAASTIANMRGGSSGCYELDNVVTLAVTPSGANTKNVYVHVQDAAGGDYSAIKLTCSISSTAHMCTVMAAVKATLAGRKVTVQGTYEKSSAAKGGFEGFFIDTITDNGTGTAPAPAALAPADLERSTTTAASGKPMAAYHFQVVTANITDKWVMYDWSPAEFTRSGSTACPQMFGFGMIPSSVGATAGAACNGMTQPAGQGAVNAKEILVSTDYSGGFKFSSDCKCAAMFKNTLIMAGQGVSGSVSGLLDYDVPYMQTTGYQYFAPMMDASFPIQ
jgi:hypothetical protein